MVKVPYTSVASLAESIRVSKSVRDNEKYDFQINSRAPRSTGNEPGTGKGVVVHGYCGMALAEKGSESVYSEGWASVCHRAPGWINRPGPGSEEQQKQMRQVSSFEAPAPQAGSQHTIPGSVAAPMQADKFTGKVVDARDLAGVRKAKTTANTDAIVVAQASAAQLAPHPERPPYNFNKSKPPNDQIGPTIHDMDNPDWDIEPTPHEYSVPDTDPSAKICSHKILACNLKNVHTSVLATNVPGQKGVAQDGDVVTVRAGGIAAGKVQIIDDGTRVTNVTLPGHVFYYGYVTRRIEDKPDGIYLSVDGQGINKTAAIAEVNRLAGPIAFRQQNTLTQQYFNNNFGGRK